MRSILTLALLVSLGGVASAQQAGPAYHLDPASNKKFLADYAHQKGVVTLPDGLEYRVIKAGRGLKVSSPLDKVTVAYKGWMINGHVFDQTAPGQAAHFQPSSLIRGWAEALVRMREGDEWELAVPASLAYGDRGAGNAIPPNQALVFDLQVIEVVPAAP